ncbi:MAG TPA: FAD-dependent oxidoreductase, partial [Steroidobacteraceae bacterium]|nr:FAD-dependent oxidoreductase [Steroidobacteraceae bacterium]
MTRIAVVGAGIAGLYASWRLARDHDVTLYEAADYAGGHTNTVDVEYEGRSWAIDTGFIVFNDWTYPNFIAMLRELGVAWQASNMSFSLRCERSGLEYNGTSVNTLFAQRRNLVRPAFLRMIVEILRFNAGAKRWLRQTNADPTLGEYLRAAGYSTQFVEHYIVPMGRAIWSAEASALLGFPTRFFLDFFERHGFLSVDDRPVWQTVRGGSREYVRALLAASRARLRLSTPVSSIRRQPNQVSVRTQAGEVEHFDYVFLACHADQALALLEQPSRAETEVLRALPFAANEAILHTDASVLPRRPLARAAWNYHLLRDPQEPVALTYDMNVLQGLQDAPTRFLVTLNHRRAIDPRRILRTFQYAHPVYTPAGVAAQRRQRELDGALRTYYCGAYWRCGFHEDGVVSAQSALAHFAEDFDRAQLPL